MVQVTQERAFGLYMASLEKKDPERASALKAALPKLKEAGLYKPEASTDVDSLTFANILRGDEQASRKVGQSLGLNRLMEVNDHLDRDPKLSQRFIRDLKEKPAETVALIKNYNPQTLGSDLDRLEGKKPAATPAAGSNPVDKSQERMVTQKAAPAPVKVVKKSPERAAEPEGDAAAVGLAALIVESVGKNFKDDDMLKKDASAFKERIEKDKALQKQIGRQIEKNPKFLEEMQGLQSDKPLPAGAKASLRPFVQKFLQNPQKLGSDEGISQTMADFRHAKSAAQSAGMQDWLKKNLGLDIGAGGMEGFVKSTFGKYMDSFQNFFAGFTGGRQVFSMSTSGSSLLPTLFINTANFNANMDAARAFARYNPTDMTAYGIKGKDGSLFHEEVVRDSKGNPRYDANGKEVTQRVPNTVDVLDAEGKVHKVIPSIGVLMAKQEMGTYDAKGQWRQGNYQVPVVTDIDSKGGPAKLGLVTMNPTEFAKYKKDMEARSNRDFPVDPTTERDAQEAGIYPNVRRGGIMIASVDRNSGMVSEPKVQYPPVATTQPVPQPQVDTRPLPPKTEASNDRRFNIDGTNS